jgi:hypothetical protein
MKLSVTEILTKKYVGKIVPVYQIWSKDSRDSFSTKVRLQLTPTITDNEFYSTYTAECLGEAVITSVGYHSSVSDDNRSNYFVVTEFGNIYLDI